MRKAILAALVCLAMLITAMPAASEPIQLGHTWGTPYWENAYAIEVDSLGNVYLAGTTNNPISPGEENFVAKVDAYGHQIWSIILSSSANTINLYDAALGPANSLYVVGQYWTLYGGGVGTYYAKIDAYGGLVYQKYLPSLGTVNRVSTGAGGSGFVMAGDVSSYGGAGAVVVVNDDGTVKWARSAESPDGESVWAAVTDSSGAVYSFRDSINDNNVAIAKFSKTGHLVKQKVLLTDFPNYEYTWDLALGRDGNIYALGANWGRGELLLASFTPKLDLIWDEYVGTPVDGFEATRLVAAADGSLYAVGYSTRGGDPAVFHLTTSGAVLDSTVFVTDANWGSYSLSDACAFPAGGILVAGGSWGFPKASAVAIEGVVVSEIPEAWTDDTTIWSTLSLSPIAGDFVVAKANAVMDNYDSNQDQQAWYGILNPPPPAFKSSISVKTTSNDRLLEFRATASGGRAPYTYEWYFGDGSKASGQKVSHEYAVGGNYLVFLVVTDARGSVSWATTSVSVPAYPVITSVTHSPEPARVGETVTFQVSAYDPDGGSLSYLWVFGDGTSYATPNAVVYHSYTAVGVYPSSVTVTDDEGLSAIALQTVNVVQDTNKHPIALFNVYPVDLYVGTLATFDATPSYDPDGWIVSYSWFFGDMGTASGLRVYHAYTSPGTYYVGLTVLDNMGASGFRGVNVTVKPTPPVASFSTTVIDKTVYVNATSSSSAYGIVSYTWYWGDGSPAEVSYNPYSAHTYATGDSYYIINLTIKDTMGQTDSTSVGVWIGIHAGQREVSYDISHFFESYLKNPSLTVQGNRTATPGLNSWWTARMMGYGDQIVRNTYPFVTAYSLESGYTTPDVDPGFGLQTMARMHITAKNLTTVGTSVAMDPVFIPILNPNVGGGVVTLQWRSDVMTAAEIAAMKAINSTYFGRTYYGAPRIYLSDDGYWNQIYGHMTFDRLAARTYLGLSGAGDLRVEFTASNANNAIGSLWMVDWLTETGTGGIYDITAAYEYANDIRQLVLTLDPSSTADHLNVRIWSMSWGNDMMLMRYMDVAGVNSYMQSYFEDMYLNATIGPTSGDIETSYYMQYAMLGWADTATGKASWMLESVHSDYVGTIAPPPTWQSRFNPYDPERTNWMRTSRLPGTIHYGQQVSYWTTPMFWNLKSGEKLTVKLPTGNAVGFGPYVGTTDVLSPTKVAELNSHAYTGQLVLGSCIPSMNSYYDQATKTITLTGPTSFQRNPNPANPLINYTGVPQFVFDVSGPIPPYSLVGITLDSSGLPLGGVMINITNMRTGEYDNTLISDSTPEAKGFYVFDLNSLGQPAMPGDQIRIVAKTATLTGMNQTTVPNPMGAYMWFNVTLTSSPPTGLTPHTPISITGNSQFTAANGVTGGSGTFADPFVISGWFIEASTTNGITISGSSAFFEIRNVKVVNGSLNYHNAIDLIGVSNGTVANCVLWSNVVGVLVENSRDVMVRGNDVSVGYEGILTMMSSSLSIVGNKVHSLQIIGIMTNSSSGIRVANNSVSNVGSGTFGFGICLSFSNSGEVVLNNVSGCVRGIALNHGNTGIRIYYNSLRNNGIQASDDNPTMNFWDSGYPGGGNFWSDYAGVDAMNGPLQNLPGADGIGDTPYVLANVTDHYPLMTPRC